MTKKLSNVDVMEVSLVDKAANKRKFLILKAQEIDMVEGTDVVIDEGHEDVLASVEQFISENEAGLAAILKLINGEPMDKEGDLENSKDSEEVEKEVEVEKVGDQEDEVIIKKDKKKDESLVAPPQVRAQIEQLMKSNKEQIAKAAELESILKAERSERMVQDFIVKASDYKHLAIEADKFGRVLKNAADKLDKQDFAEIERVLKSSDAGMAELFKEAGVTGVSETMDKDPISKAESLASVLAEKESITKEQAFVKILDTHSELAKAVKDLRT